MAFMGKKVFGLIPARGGSKGLPNKNMLDLFGQPMLYYSILASKKSNFIDTTVVSSDSDKILNFALTNNVEALKRPKKFAADNSPATSVVNHFAKYIKSKYGNEDIIICYLQPTSPLRSKNHIDDAFNTLIEKKKETLLSVSETDKIPYKMFTINKNGLLQSLFNESMTNMRRQDLPKCYIANGAMYIFPLKTFEINNKFPSNHSIPYIMGKNESIDVDNANDLMLVKNAFSKERKE